MKDQEQDELWTLLGRAKEPNIPPFFAAKTVAAVRRLQERKRLFWQNSLRFGIPGALAGAMAVFFAFSGQPMQQNPSPRQAVIAQTEPGDLEVIADLDVNMASEESSVWLDSSAH